MEHLLKALTDEPGLLVGVILGLAGMVTLTAVVALIARAARHSSREREQTRRELAAYVSEGTISSEDAERLLSPSPWWIKTIKLNGKDVRQTVREHFGA